MTRAYRTKVPQGPGGTACLAQMAGCGCSISDRRRPGSAWSAGADRTPRGRASVGRAGRPGLRYSSPPIHRLVRENALATDFAQHFVGAACVLLPAAVAAAVAEIPPIPAHR